MQTQLDRLLSSINPEETIVETFNRANEAINTFHPNSALIKDWEEFKVCMASFVQYVYCYCLRLHKQVDMSSDYFWSLCVKVFREIYGPNGEKAAFEMTRTGHDKGLCGLLRSVAIHIAQELVETEIRAKVNSYLEGLSVDQQLEASSEYLAKHGHLLPSEMTEASAGRIHDRFRKVLEKHPWLILKIHEAVR